jgi:hypothetical protein
MANKKDKEPQNFVVTDKRRFSDEGEPQTPAGPAEEEQSNSAAQPTPHPAASPEASPSHPASQAEDELPPLTAEERSEGNRVYWQAVDAMDDQLRKEIGNKAFDEEFKMGIDRLVEPFYVTAMMQLGMLGQEGTERRVDIIGARQTIDTLNYLTEKTKGNLTPAEGELLENVIYQLRMSYLEITSALAKAVQNPPGGSPKIPNA